MPRAAKDMLCIVADRAVQENTIETLELALGMLDMQQFMPLGWPTPRRKYGRGSIRLQN